MRKRINDSMITFHLPAVLKELLVTKANEKEITYSELLRDCINNQLKEKGLNNDRTN